MEHKNSLTNNYKIFHIYRSPSFKFANYDNFLENVNFQEKFNYSTDKDIEMVIKEWTKILCSSLLQGGVCFAESIC